MGGVPLRSLLLLLAGCGFQSHDAADAGPEPVPDAAPSCIDLDHDGYGAGEACLGPDCVDDDPAQHECCAPGSGSEGCPCAIGEPPRGCYEGPPGTEGLGLCRAGARSCDAGIWSTCRGQVFPEPEMCDGDDNDCDGVADDDGVLFGCGDCNPACLRERFGMDGKDFDRSDMGNVLSEGDGAVTLTDGHSHGVITLLFDESRNGDCPPKHGPIGVGAEVPEGSSLTFELRARHTELESHAPWRTVLVLPGGESPAVLFPEEEDEYWMLVELRITFLAAPGGATPRLQWLTVDHRYISCTD